MIEIIETNMILNEDDIMSDFQSRVIQHSSWQDYIEEIQNEKCEIHEGTMFGCTLPRLAKVSNLNYDDKHLSCDVYNGIVKLKKLAYLI